VSQRYSSPDPGCIQQTAILRDVPLPEVHFRTGEEASAILSSYPWLIVLNQDCDLQLDRLARAGEPLRAGGPPVKKDKLLRSVVLCPAFPRDHVLAGTYVEDATEWRGTQKDILLQNRHERYHVLPVEGPVTEPLVLDFKLIAAVHPDYLQQWIEQHPASVVAVLCPPYRDRLVQRFVNYFGRIAEPEEM
jgi:hypothetical protein